ncbi:dynamin GTPase effector domain-containing protein [Ditylenchus destructor]|nr:dynamin GTPase effector domain-containing protein [Ditylenchus destructor]KAI1705721.1 dynamin GTPase effector domain-containing protein [Ditylenchus destructor]
MIELEKMEIEEKEQQIRHVPKSVVHSTDSIPQDGNIQIVSNIQIQRLYESLNEIREAESRKNKKQAPKPNTVQNNIASSSAMKNDEIVSSEESQESSFNHSYDIDSADSVGISPANSTSHSAAENNLQYGKFCCFREIVNIYFNDVRKKLIDIVPKIIGKFLIEDFLFGNDGIGRHLSRNLTDFEKLLVENEDIKCAREKLKNQLTSLKKAQASINELKNSTFRKY